ncbi:MAG: Gfo/Idh/MocA family oxidoreductase [Terriglobia bacterium]
MSHRLGILAIVFVSAAALSVPSHVAAQARTRLAIVGLDHDHVWGILKLIASEPDCELVAIAETHPELIQKAKAMVPESVKFFSNYVAMLDEVKPDAVIVTTANNRHLEILRACAKRKIHFDTEKPMAANGADAREMERLAREAGIKLMVNYGSAWPDATQEALRRIEAGEVGNIQKIIVQFGHEGPKEIGTSKYFSDWLYDPVKNGAGALMDFGCYGADWAMVLKGRPQRVYATSLKLKTEQHNAVEDDATVLLEYADATAILMPSWDWSYGKGQAEIFGTKGSFLVRGDGLLFQPAKGSTSVQNPDGKPVETQPVAPERRNGVAYFLYCIRNNKPIEGPVSAAVNVGVNEIIDAAKESIRTGKAVALPAE